MMFQDKIKQALVNVTSLSQTRDKLFSLFRDNKDEGFEKLGYVSGPTPSVEQDLQIELMKLKKSTERIRSENDFPVFSAIDIFEYPKSKNIQISGLANNDQTLLAFWREILSAEERFVTDVFMLPGWEGSILSNNDFNNAKEMGIKIHYVTEL